MSDLISKFVEAQLQLSKAPPTPMVIEPKKAKVAKKDVRVIEPSEEMEEGETMDERFDNIIAKHPRKKVVLEYLQDLIDIIIADED